LRQQLHPSIRVHGALDGNDPAPNVIPDKSKITWHVRARTWSGVQQVSKRLMPCFEAAAMATGCEVKIELNTQNIYYDLRQNSVLGLIYFPLVRRLPTGCSVFLLLSSRRIRETVQCKVRIRL